LVVLIDKNGTKLIDDFLRQLLGHESVASSDTKLSSDRQMNSESTECNNGYSAEWHVNPLLLEPNFARVAIALK
jgi:hypothetical protein